jgi:hypothetical protein
MHSCFLACNPLPSPTAGLLEECAALRTCATGAPPSVAPVKRRHLEACYSGFVVLLARQIRWEEDFWRQLVQQARNGAASRARGAACRARKGRARGQMAMHPGEHDKIFCIVGTRGNYQRGRCIWVGMRALILSALGRGVRRSNDAEPGASENLARAAQRGSEHVSTCSAVIKGASPAAKASAGRV